MPTKSKPVEEKKTFIEEARRKQIIDAALQTIAEQGYTQTSFAEIAKSLGITKGLIALVMALHDGKTPEEIGKVDVFKVFKEIGLGAHLTSKRSNGVRSMAERIHRDAARLAA